MATHLDENISYDAQQLTEEIEAGKQEVPDIDVEAAYEESKKYATRDDHPASQSAATEEVAPQPSLSTLGEVRPDTEEDQQPTGDPEAFLSMAREITQPH